MPPQLLANRPFRIPQSAILLPLLACPAFSGAALLLYEGFDSTRYDTTGGYASPAGASNALVWDPDVDPGNGNHVAQGPSVHGFASSPWVHGAAINSIVYGRLENSQQSYTGLTTTTGQLNIQRSGSGSGDKIFSRNLSLGGGTSASLPETLYISGLITRNATSFNLSFSSSNTISNPTTLDTRTFRMAVDGAGTVTFSQNGGSSVTSATPLWDASSSPVFFVMKIENSVLNEASPTSGDKISLYLNPDLSSEAANTPVFEYGDAASAYYVIGNSDYAMDSMSLMGSPANGGSVIFDELRFADSWEDAHSAIPEPHAALVASLIFTLCGLRRGRRKEGADGLAKIG